MDILALCLNATDNMPGISMEACLAARATIRAGEIQAKATRHAGTDTLWAGIFALTAGYLAYRSATRQIRASEAQYRQRVVSYCHLLMAVILEAKHELESLRWSTDHWHDCYHTDQAASELAAENWERHALVGIAGQALIFNFRSLISKLTTQPAKSHHGRRFEALTPFLNEGGLINAIGAAEALLGYLSLQITDMQETWLLSRLRQVKWALRRLGP